MNGDIFENAPRVDADLFYTDEKKRFQKYPDTCIHFRYPFSNDYNIMAIIFRYFWKTCMKVKLKVKLRFSAPSAGIAEVAKR